MVTLAPGAADGQSSQGLGLFRRLRLPQVTVLVARGEPSRALLGGGPRQQVVIKSIEENYGTVPGIAAATILGNGRVAFILDSEKIYDLACETMNNTLAGAAGSRLTQKTAA